MKGTIVVDFATGELAEIATAEGGLGLSGALSVLILSTISDRDSDAGSASISAP